MRLVGWNDIPRGYSADFDLSEAPLWLRVWFKTPFVDRFAHPIVVRRGYGWLTPDRGSAAGPVSDGWRVRPPDHTAPGSVVFLRPE